MRALENMSLSEAITQIMNHVYTETGLYESLEGAQKVHGNGHHIRQEMARLAGKMMFERWSDKEEKKQYMETHSFEVNEWNRVTF